jgi:hypothetical protein
VQALSHCADRLPCPFYLTFPTYAYALLGELGCPTSDKNKTSLRHQPEQLLQRAKDNLDRFCVVFVHERLNESLAYLHHVTGWGQVAKKLLVRGGPCPGKSRRCFRLHGMLA